MRETKRINRTRILVVIMGILTGFGGALHGIFETLQTNKPSGGIFSETLGGFTIIHNFRISGIIAVITGVSIIFWTILFIHKKYGPIIYLLLSIILFLAGGGVAQVLGFLMTWAVATRINKPLTWSRKWSGSFRKLLSKLWLPFIITGFTFFFTGIAIWLILMPPVVEYKIGMVHYVCWSFLVAGFSCLILTVFSGFAADIEISLIKGE